MGSALTIYFKSILRSNLTSPAMYIGLLFFGVFFSIVGAYGSKIPLQSWFSMSYLMYLFATMGGLARMIVVGSGAYNYLIRHAGVSPVKLTLTLIASHVITAITLTPLYLIIFITVYYTAGEPLPSLDLPLLSTTIILSALFITAFGIVFGLVIIGRTIAAKIANFIPSIPLIIYFISLLTPYDMSMYNPITAIIILLTASWKNLGATYVFPIPSSHDIATPIATLAISSVMLILASTLLMKRVREVNIYDIAMSL